MKLWFASLAALCALVQPAAASTTVPGGNVINQTWTVAGSPYIVQGDITIPDGATLTIDAGVEVDLPGGDLQAAGISTSEVEVVVHGSLAIHGTAAAPVRFVGAAAKAWYGIELYGTTPSVLDHVVLANGDTALVYGATGNTITGSGIDIESPAGEGVLVESGAPVFDGLIVRHTQLGYNGISVRAGSPTFTNCLVQDIGRRALEAAGDLTEGPGTVTITNCTFDHAQAEAVFNFVPTGEPFGTMTIANSIVTNSGGGLAGQWLTGDHCDVWNNTPNFDVYASCPNCMSQNPQYVSATDLHLLATSVAIDVATMGPDHDLEGHVRPVDGDGLGGAQWDLGAYEYGSTAGSNDGGTGDAGAGGDSGAGNGDHPDGGVDGGGAPGAGCCQTGSGSGGGVALALVVMMTLRRRRGK